MAKTTSTYLRRHCIMSKTGQKEVRVLTAKDVRDRPTMDSMVRDAAAYTATKNLRGSPAYFNSRSSHLKGMIRLLGPSTWFMSQSIVESKWVPLLQLLEEKLHSHRPTEAEVMEYDEERVQELVNSDPITCARVFDLRTQHLFNHCLQSAHSPIGEMVDFFYRVEFQKRGTPRTFHNGYTIIAKSLYIVTKP
jgi:hypothetical protein